MIKLILYIIVIGIILEHLLLLNKNNNVINDNVGVNKKKKKYKTLENKPKINELNYQPWNKITFDETSQYPYTFYISLDIPSFNIYHDWKQIIPTLNFIPQTKELTISTINEDIAIAIINLVILTFSNKVSLDEIIEKDLINISISKVSDNPDIKSNFRNQIIQYISNPPQQESTQDMSLQEQNMPLQEQNMSLQKQPHQEYISAYDGNDYSYL